MINIDKRKSKRLEGEESLFISFPYNHEVVNIMRQQKSRWYHPETREWELPTKTLDTIISDIGIRPHSINFKQVLPDPQYITIPKEFEPLKKPFKHQEDGLIYGLNKDYFLLADEMGLGKTKQVIDIAVAKKMMYGYKKCLIICGVNGIKWNCRSTKNLNRSY